MFNVGRDIANRYRSPQQPGDGKTPTTAGGSRGRALYRDVNSQWVHDAGFLSVRNITLNYQLPPRVFGRQSNSSSVYFALQNAFMITSYPGNPEVTNYNYDQSPLNPATDFTPYPVPRVFTVGTRIGF